MRTRKFSVNIFIATTNNYLSFPMNFIFKLMFMIMDIREKDEIQLFITLRGYFWMKNYIKYF